MIGIEPTPLEVECLAEQIYRSQHEARSLYVPWLKRCNTVRDGYRAAARRQLIHGRMMEAAIGAAVSAA